MNYKENSDIPLSSREMATSDHRTIIRTFSDIIQNDISILEAEARKKTDELTELSERIVFQKGSLQQLEDELAVATKRNTTSIYDEEFVMPDWDDVIANYPQITGVHRALEAYPHKVLQDSFNGLCIRWQGITDPILIDEDGLLLDGRLRLLVEHRFPEESLGDVPFEMTNANPWETVYLKNGGRIRSLTDLGAVTKQSLQTGRGTAPGTVMVSKVIISCAVCAHGENDIQACEYRDCSPRIGHKHFKGAKKSCLNCQYQINDGDPDGWIEGLHGINADKFSCVHPQKKGQIGSPITPDGWCLDWKLAFQFVKP